MLLIFTTAGSGKNTIIAMLIALQHSMRRGHEGTERPLYLAPGRPGDPNPTTGDVHLYSDPGTQGTRMPILFTDCEGLDGGDKLPTGAGEAVKSSARRIRARRVRNIRWAKEPGGQKRDFFVLDMFSEILYTFSDVVVFVLREPRALESVTAKHILPWANNSIDKSLNQTVRPHIIVVLNACDVGATQDDTE